MCFKIILKVTENQGFTVSLEDTFFEKPQGGQFDPEPLPKLTKTKDFNQINPKLSFSRQCYRAGKSFWRSSRNFQSND